MALFSATGMAVHTVKLVLVVTEPVGGLVAGEYPLCGRGLSGPAWQAGVTGTRAVMA
jgi:hypothetical protein